MLFSCIFSIGKEIVTGTINDTNSSFIASELTRLGIGNRFIISTDDDEKDITETFLYFLPKVDIVITTGGLGPTFDDITLACIAKALNRKLVLSESSYRKIKEFYDRLHKEGKIDSPGMNPKREKMAYIPEGAVELENSVGAASGVYIKHEGKHIFCLPGVPSEMRPMFEKQVKPILRELSSGCILSKTYEFEINDESVLGEFVDSLLDLGVHIKSLPTGFDSKTMGVRFTAHGRTEKECIERIEHAKKRLSELLDS